MSAQDALTGVSRQGDSWGICTDKPRLPGLGYDYNILDLSSTASAGFDHLPGCSFPALQMIGNIAGRYDKFSLSFQNLYAQN